MDSLRAVKRRHEEREATIAAEEAARLPGGGGQTAERKDWKSGNMQDYYRKWDTFAEAEADKQVEASQKKAAPIPPKTAMPVANDSRARAAAEIKKKQDMKKKAGDSTFPTKSLVDSHLTHYDVSY